MLPNPKTCKGSEETVIPSVRSEIFCTINEHPDVHWGRRGLPSFFLFRYQHLMSIILPRFRFSTSKPHPFLLLSFTSSCCGHVCKIGTRVCNEFYILIIFNIIFRKFPAVIKFWCKLFQSRCIFDFFHFHDMDMAQQLNGFV